MDRDLGWLDVARVLLEEGGTDAADDPEVLARKAAWARKRFQLVKERLRELARKEGLLDV